ncbi:N-acetylmuramoyl-L-alanine amidase [Streptosporangium sp. NPDC049376]|uniref:peptidoglycan recognition protein family protein n=1 Tax=Streptosporangium sp. NPDC049376 TaxID=3366192 RepID=UPI0037A81801
MARMPGAQWRPISVNYTRYGQVEVRGVVLHIMAGTLTGTDAWFRNPAASASSHFGTSRAGELRQWVDTKDRAWAQGTGNRSWISIENEGRGGDVLTDEQLDACARILAWAHQEHGVPLQATNDPNGRGLGHHGMGGAAWGGHLACPGARIVAQKREIIARAKRLLAGQEDGPPPWPGRLLKYVTGAPLMSGQDVRTWQAALTRAAFPVRIDGYYGAKSHAATRAFQRAHRLVDDGVVGPATWRAGVR